MQYNSWSADKKKDKYQHKTYYLASEQILTLLFAKQQQILADYSVFWEHFHRILQLSMTATPQTLNLTEGLSFKKTK